MTSQISRTLSGYQKALRDSEKRFTDMYEATAQNAVKFYEDFFKDLLRPYQPLFKNPAELRHIRRILTTFFGTDEIRFAAIDGTNFKDTFSEYMVFFGASYGVKGTLSLQGDPPTVRYERWSTDEDVSFVSYIPIPFAELTNIDEGQFTAYSDQEKINLSFIDTQLMQLAEVYLAYDFISTSALRPKLVLIDHSMSSIMMSNTVGVRQVNMIGFNHSGRTLKEQDIVVTLSHPYNETLNIPYPKKTQLYEFILKELYLHGPQMWEEIANRTPYSTEEVKSKVEKSHIFRDFTSGNPLVEIDNTGHLQISNEYLDSWRWTKDLFKSICERLFKDKDQSALRYTFIDEIGEEREGWMTPTDLKFLISIGIRALIEECWKHEIFLIGITKDSSSKYLTRNYLGVLRECGHYDFKNIVLPWTDRAFLEVIPHADDSLEAPWATIEFDACFMTLANRKLTTDEEPHIQGVRGDIIAPQPRLFARSLGQFFINRSKHNPLTGHVIFIDRLIQPRLDSSCFGELVIGGGENEGLRIGTIEPLAYLNKGVPNDAQDLMMFSLHILTRNLYPKMIGYPDPLHKADWGAKSIRNKIIPIIKSSSIELRIRPLNRTVRDIRAGRGGR